MPGPKYSKIETLFNRGEDFAVLADEHEFRVPEFAMIKKWYVTEKLDGTNVRVHWDGSTVSFGGRTDRAQMPTDLLEMLQSVLTFENLSVALGDEGSMTLFGEGIGGRIQKVGPLYGELAFVLFDVRLGNGMWLEVNSIQDIARKLGVLSVPVLDFYKETSHIVDFVRRGFKTEYPAADPHLEAEGVVARAFPMLLTRRGHRLIWKLKTKDFKPGKRR
jgi:hypothetical protein